MWQNNVNILDRAAVYTMQGNSCATNHHPELFDLVKALGRAL